MKFRPRKKRVVKIRGKNVDYTDLNNIFYKEYFKPPRDFISTRFKELLKVKHYQDKFPPLVLEGLANLKPKLLAPFKRIPKYSLLKQGKYEEGTSNSDIKVTSINIQFFLNQLPSFAKYRDSDDLDWVIREHRLLALEIFEYYKDAPKTSLCTFSQRFNSILRIMRIAYQTKSQPIYKLFSTLVFQFHGKFVRKEGENKLNEREKNKFIHWKDVLTIQKKMEDTFNAMPDKLTQKAYDYNNDLLLLSLYCLMPSLRNELKHMEFRNHPRYKDVDYVYINKNQTKVILKFNLDKKQHGEIDFDLTEGDYKNEHLANILRQSYSLYKRDYLFTLKNKYPAVNEKATERALNERLKNIFFNHGIENQITVNSLRSSFISYIWSNPNTTNNEKKKIAIQMRSSLYCLDTFYNKIHSEKPILCNKKTCKKGCEDFDDNNDNNADNNECSQDYDENEYDDINDEDDDNDNDDNDEDNNTNNNKDNNTNKIRTNKPKNMKDCFMKCCNNLCNDKYKQFVKTMNSTQPSNNMPIPNTQQNKSQNKDKNDNTNTKKKNQNIPNDLDDIDEDRESFDESEYDDNDDNEEDIDNDDQNNNNRLDNGQNNNNRLDNGQNKVVPEENLTQYQKKLLRNKQYYEKNKNKIIKRVTENNKNKTPFEKTRERIMQLLNASPDYAQKIKPTTIAKYKFIYDDQLKRWKWEE